MKGLSFGPRSPKTSSVETWWNLPLEYFLKASKRFIVPIILVSANRIGFDIELSTCDSAARLITSVIAFFLKNLTISSRFLISSFSKKEYNDLLNIIIFRI